MSSRLLKMSAFFHGMRSLRKLTTSAQRNCCLTCTRAARVTNKLCKRSGEYSCRTVAGANNILKSSCHFSTTAFLVNKKEVDSKPVRLIYVGEVGGMLKAVQGGMYLISMGLIGTAPFVLQQLAGSTVMEYTYMIYVGIFGILNPGLFYKLGKRYVHKLYHDTENDTYTAMLASPIVLGYKSVTFSPRDCRMPANATMLTSFIAKGQPLFVNSDVMDYGSYSRMLRYASEFDYENPKRQTQYKDAVKDSVERLTKKKDEQTES